MNYRAMRSAIEAAEKDGDVEKLAELAKGLLNGHQEIEKKLNRLVNISTHAAGYEDEWNHTVRAITG